MRVVKIKNLKKSHENNNTFLVKGRIKPQPKIYHNANNSGKHLRAVLFDKTSKINLVAYDDNCDKFFHQLQTDCVICLEGVTLKKNESPFETPDHRYSITFKSNSVIKIINDDELSTAELSHFPKDNFTKGNDLLKLIPRMTVDVVGQIFEDGRCKKIVVDFQEFTVFFSEPIDDIQNGTALCIYNATFKRNTRRDILAVGKYSFFRVISNEEYLLLSTTAGGLSENGQQFLPNHSVVAADSPGTLLAQGSSTSRSSQLNIGSPNAQIIQIPQTESASFPSSNSPYKKLAQEPSTSKSSELNNSSPTTRVSQNPQSAIAPVPSSSSPNKLSAQKPSTSQLNKRHMQNFDDDETVPKVFKKTDVEVPLMSDENFIRNVYGRLAVCSEVDKQRIQLKVLNLIEDEIKEITQYDDFTQDN